MEAQLPTGTTPANKVWNIEALRRSIIELADGDSLFQLLLVNDAAFRMAASQLYKAIPDQRKFQDFLDRIPDTRYMIYSKAVRHIYDVPDGALLGPLILAFPNLCYVCKMGYHEYSWRVQPDGYTVSASVTLSEDMLADDWSDIVKSHRSKLPREWLVEFRPRNMHVRTPEDIKRWRKACGDTCILPQHLFLQCTEPTDYFEALEYAATAERNVTFYSRMDHSIYLSDLVDAKHHEGCERFISPLATALPALKGLIRNINIENTPMPRHVIVELAASLRQFPELKLHVDHYARSSQTSIDVLRAELPDASCMQTTSAVCCISVSPDDLGLNGTRPASHGAWLHDLARTMLVTFGSAVDYSVQLQLGHRCFFTEAEIHAAGVASETLTLRLCDIIRTIVDCRRLLQPIGWRRLEAEERVTRM